MHATTKELPVYLRYQLSRVSVLWHFPVQCHLGYVYCSSTLIRSGMIAHVHCAPSSFSNKITSTKWNSRLVCLLSTWLLQLLGGSLSTQAQGILPPIVAHRFLSTSAPWQLVLVPQMHLQGDAMDLNRIPPGRTQKNSQSPLLLVLQQTLIKLPL